MLNVGFTRRRCLNMVELEVSSLKKYFPVQKSFIERILTRKKQFIRAVDGISFKIFSGQVFSLAGESGCGKTTTGRLVVRLEKPDEGKIVFEGKDITFAKEKELRPLRRKMQIIFQDPYASLNPRMRIGDAIAEPLIVHGIADKREAKEEALKMLENVGLTPAHMFYKLLPHQLSGGQRQRVAIARAMILKPKFIVADEPVSMIDVSLRASILKLIMKFKSLYNLSILFITHDLAVARLISDTIAVMYLGKIVEIASTEELIDNPMHPYTKALLSSVPSLFRRKKEKIILKGEIANPINPPSGCRLHPRCPFAKSICSKEEPKLVSYGNNHYVACHFPLLGKG